MPYKDKARQKKFQREWCAKRRAEYFEGKVCVQCKTTFKLQLHHIDPSQKVSHRIWSWSKARREKELAKCEPRCEDCHSLFHRTRGEAEPFSPKPPYI